MMMLLVQALGLKQILKLGLWGIRLVVLGFLLFFLFVLLVAGGWLLVKNEDAQVAAKWIAGLGLGAVIFRAFWVRRKVEPYVGERTIDGKVVPSMLAAAALAIPPYSPDPMRNPAPSGIYSCGHGSMRVNGRGAVKAPQTLGMRRRL